MECHSSSCMDANQTFLSMLFSDVFVDVAESDSYRNTLIQNIDQIKKAVADRIEKAHCTQKIPYDKDVQCLLN